MQLCDEDWEEGMCGKLNKAMYGTRDAAMNWTAAYTSVLVEKMGFAQGVSTPCALYHHEYGIRTVVHGDDFTTLASDADMDWYEGELKKSFEIKVRGRLGLGCTGPQEIKILNRIVRWTTEGLEYEADPRHVEIMLAQLELADAKEVDVATRVSSAVNSQREAPA